MPSDSELEQFRRRQDSVSADDSQRIVANLPPYPDDLKERFPSMAEHENKLKDWVKELIIAIRGGAG